MMPHKLRSTSPFPVAHVLGVLVTAFACLCLISAPGFCAEVPSGTARQVAQGVIQRHLSLFGHWNSSRTPALGDSDIIRYDSEIVAFNFNVEPSGHILVVAEDDLNPVPLYSTRSKFVPGRSNSGRSIESWIVPEVQGRVHGMRAFQRNAAAALTGAAVPSGDRSAARNAWAFFTRLAQEGGDAVVRTLDAGGAVVVRSAVVGPLLTTAWGQEAPYNLQTPDDNCSGGHTLAGCVATAWAQVLNYWQWPDSGVGSHSYVWSSSNGAVTISADFSGAFDWADMPECTDFSRASESCYYSGMGSIDEQNNAVSELIFKVGVAADMDFGCNSSGSSAWADDVLDLYFRYKAMTYHERSDYPNAEQWFNLFKTELDAASPRPVIFSIQAPQGWHEVVVDGYQEGPPNLVHINFGWENNYDGYYDVSDDDDFNAGYDWSVDAQYAVAGIEPYHGALPVVDGGVDQTVQERATFTLTGSATLSSDIKSYQWQQVSGPVATALNSDLAEAEFKAPSVSTDSQLVFLLKAVNQDDGVGFDTVTITVRNTDVPVSGVTSSSSGSGGCFVTSLH